MKILIIENNPSNLKLFTEILKYSKYEVFQAIDAIQGIDMTIKIIPDIILMDIQLPGIDGFTALKILKSEPKTTHIKVIALTSFAMKGDKERILNAGFDDYIAKPIQFRQLLETINQHLKKQNGSKKA